MQDCRTSCRPSGLNNGMARLTLCSCLLAVGCSPYLDSADCTYDNRSLDRVQLVRVSAEGHLDLSDGRTVRLFGVLIPPEERLRGQYDKSIRDWLRGDVGFEAVEMLPGTVPAVWLRVYGIPFRCGTCEWLSSRRRTRSGLYSFEPHVVNMLRGGVFEPSMTDLDDPRAQEWAVKQLRDALSKRGS